MNNDSRNAGNKVVGKVEAWKDDKMGSNPWKTQNQSGTRVALKKDKMAMVVFHDFVYGVPQFELWKM